MGLRQLRANVVIAERTLQTQRQVTGKYLDQTQDRIRGWFGPWRVVGVGAAIGAFFGWVGKAGGPSNSGESSQSTASGGGGVASAISQATQLVQLLTIATPLLAQFKPLAESFMASSEQSAETAEGPRSSAEND